MKVARSISQYGQNRASSPNSILHDGHCLYHGLRSRAFDSRMISPMFTCSLQILLPQNFQPFNLDSRWPHEGHRRNCGGHSLPRAFLPIISHQHHGKASDSRSTFNRLPCIQGSALLFLETRLLPIPHSRPFHGALFPCIRRRDSFQERSRCTRAMSWHYSKLPSGFSLPVPCTCIDPLPCIWHGRAVIIKAMAAGIYHRVYMARLPCY